MRRVILVAGLLLTTAAAGGAAWHFLRPRDPLAEARQLMARGDARAAALVLRGLVRDHPELAEAHLRLGEVQLVLDDPTAAEKELLAARDGGSDGHAIAPLLARAVVAQGRFEDLLRDPVPAGLSPAQAAVVTMARGEAQFALKQTAAAAASIAEAQRLAPNSSEVNLAAARMAVASGDAAAASTQVEAALAINPGSLEALMMQAALRAARGERAAALASYDTAVTLASAAGGGASVPGGAGGGGVAAIRLARAGLLMADNQDKAARADVDAALAAQPDSPLAHYLSARLEARAEDWKAADTDLGAVGPVLERLPRAGLLLALVKAKVGQPEQAVEAARRAAARAPDDLAAVKLLARLHLAAGRADDAAAVLTAARAAGHADAESLDLLGQIDANTGKPAEALAAIAAASALAPADANVLTRLAALQLRQGNGGQATTTLEHALDLAGPAATPDAKPAATAAAGDAIKPVSLMVEKPAAPSRADTAEVLVATALHAGEIDRAAAALEKLRQAGGDPARVALFDGMIKTARVDLAGARAAFETAHRLDPASMAPRLSLARVMAAQGHVDEAATLLQQTLDADRGNAAVLAALVDLRLAARQPELAVAAAEAAHAAKPDDAGILDGLAELYTRTGQPAKALAVLDAAPKGNSPDKSPPGLLAARAHAQLAAGQRAGAIVSLRALLEKAPDDITLRRQLAELLGAEKDFSGARDVLRDGLARQPGDSGLLGTAILVAGQEGGPDAAAAKAAELADNPSNGVAALRLRGDLMMRQNHPAEAAAYFQSKLANLTPDGPDADRFAARAGEALAASGDTAKATSLLTDYLTAHPASPTTALALAGLDIAANRLPDAATRLKTVLASQPDNAAALNNLAWVTQQTGDLPRARALAARGYLLAASPQAADTLGWVMLAQGDAAPAVTLLREAARGQPDDPSVQYHLAAALARDGQKDAARDVLRPLVIPVAGHAATFAEKPEAETLWHGLAKP